MNRQNALCFNDCYMKDEHLYKVPVIPSNTLRCPQNRKMWEIRNIGDSITFMPNGKHEFVPRDQVSRNFLSVMIVLSCFYLLLFYFEQFSTWIWRLLLAVYMKLKLSINSHICGKQQTSDWCWGVFRKENNQIKTIQSNSYG